MIICIKHPKYRGKHPPELSCKVCCRQFLNEIKRQHQPQNNLEKTLASESNQNKDRQKINNVLR